MNLMLMMLFLLTGCFTETGKKVAILAAGRISITQIQWVVEVKDGLELPEDFLYMENWEELVKYYDIKYQEDNTIFGDAQSSKETLEKKHGDCEDFLILAMSNYQNFTGFCFMGTEDEEYHIVGIFKDNTVFVPETGFIQEQRKDVSLSSSKLIVTGKLW